MRQIECACGRHDTVPDDSLRTTCFKCHVQGVSFGFAGGGGYGRSNWNKATIGETIRSYGDSDSAAYVGRRWV